ncbi:MAG TPA: hypothetical protein VJ816_00980 [Gemmatimonadales bacterium]|nr:hypothetical protein [Gemmatimonadales bacterium]
MRKAPVMAGLLAVVASGAMLMEGTAIAGHHHHRGGNGYGGDATNNCINVGVPILSGIGIAGSGHASGARCRASANGNGGNG